MQGLPSKSGQAFFHSKNFESAIFFIFSYFHEQLLHHGLLQETGLLLDGEGVHICDVKMSIKICPKLDLDMSKGSRF